MCAFEDLWELPDPRSTSTLSTELENNFYSRCPPETRPKCYHSQYFPSLSSKEGEPTSSPGNKENTEGEKTTSYNWQWSWFHKKPKVFKADSAGNEKYDSSLLKALHRIFFVRWWTAGILVLIAGVVPSLQSLWLGASLLFVVSRRHASNYIPARQQTYTNLAHRCVCIFPLNGRTEIGQRHDPTSGHWVWYWTGVCIVRHARSVTIWYFIGL